MRYTVHDVTYRLYTLSGLNYTDIDHKIKDKVPRIILVDGVPANNTRVYYPGVY